MGHVKLCSYSTTSALRLRPIYLILVYWFQVAVSCSGCISVSALTTALQYCKKVNLRCSALSCGRYVIDTLVMQLHCSRL